MKTEVNKVIHLSFYFSSEFLAPWLAKLRASGPIKCFIFVYICDHITQALCFQLMTLLCGYLWQFVIFFVHFISHFFVSWLCLCQCKGEKKVRKKENMPRIYIPAQVGFVDFSRTINIWIIFELR